MVSLPNVTAADGAEVSCEIVDGFVQCLGTVDGEGSPRGYRGSRPDVLPTDVPAVGAVAEVAGEGKMLRGNGGDGAGAGAAKAGKRETCGEGRRGVIRGSHIS